MSLSTVKPIKMSICGRRAGYQFLHSQYKVPLAPCENWMIAECAITTTLSCTVCTHPFALKLFALRSSRSVFCLAWRRWRAQVGCTLNKFYHCSVHVQEHFLNHFWKAIDCRPSYKPVNTIARLSGLYVISRMYRADINYNLVGFSVYVFSPPC